jgi:MFS family permease
MLKGKEGAEGGEIGTLIISNSEQRQEKDRDLSSVDIAVENSGNDTVPRPPDEVGIDGANGLAVGASPPDGGFAAWWQVFMAHIVIFNTWGYINSFGLFQTYYESTLNESASTISWIGSIQVFLLFFMGTVSGRAADAGYFKLVFSTGLLLQLIGMFMTSLCTTYWQLLLAQGICTGLGNGLLFCATLSVLSTYFLKRRAQALGIVACGSATGGIVFPIIAQKLLHKVGFGWTVRVMGFIMLGTMCFPLAFSKSRLPPRRSGPLIEWRAFLEVPYTLYTIGITMCFWGMYFAYYYVSDHFQYPNTRDMF